MISRLIPTQISRSHMPEKQKKPQRKAKAGTPAKGGVSTDSVTPKSRYPRFVTDILDRTTPDGFDLLADSSMAEFLLPPVAKMTRVVPVGIYLDTDNDSDISLAFEIWAKAFQQQGFEIVAAKIVRGSAFITLFAQYEPIHKYDIRKKISRVVDFATAKLPRKLKTTAIILIGASTLVSFSANHKAIKQAVHGSGRQTWEEIFEKVEQASESGEKEGARVLAILEMLLALKEKSPVKKEVRSRKKKV